MKAACGLALIFANCDLFFCTNEWKRDVSFLGSVKYRYVSWNKDSRSFTLEFPRIPSAVAENTGFTDTDFPASVFLRSVGENSPTPMVVTSAVAYSALNLSASP